MDSKTQKTVATRYAILMEHENDVARRLEGRGRDLRSVKKVRLIKTSWLSDDDLMKQLDAVLASYRAAGGRIEHSKSEL